MEKALLVTVKLESEKDRWPIEDIAQEIEELAATAGAQAVDNITCLREKPTPNFFIGRGKAEEIALICASEDIELVIFSHDLSGTQQRNLEEAIGKKTIDRTQLILDIFAKHATSPEGKMQVELAQLQYLLPRLTGKGVILSRMGGGIGTRGPGEQKLETDRRQIRKRIAKLEQDLRSSGEHRKIIRKRRQENNVPFVALVGYTNAGKSTLMNALTEAGQFVKDSLFTTLDTVSKGLQLKNGEQIVLSDTVGFLHNLPHHLVESFKATLEEVRNADLLLHVLDVSHPRAREHAQAVKEVLKQIGADENKIITVLNKIDLVEDKTWLGHLANDFDQAASISAKLKINLEELLGKIEESFRGRMSAVEFTIPHSRMDLLDLCHRQGQVKEAKYLSQGVKIKAVLPKIFISRYFKGIEVKYAD